MLRRILFGLASLGLFGAAAFTALVADTTDVSAHHEPKDCKDGGSQVISQQASNRAKVLFSKFTKIKQSNHQVGLNSSSGCGKCDDQGVFQGAENRAVVVGSTGTAINQSNVQVGVNECGSTADIGNAPLPLGTRLDNRLAA